MQKRHLQILAGVLGALCIGCSIIIAAFAYVLHNDRPGRIAHLEDSLHRIQEDLQGRLPLHTLVVTNLITSSALYTNLPRTIYVDPATSREAEDLVAGIKYGRIISASLSDWSPRAEITKFEVLRVESTHLNDVRVVLRIAPESRVHMGIAVTVFYEQ